MKLSPTMLKAWSKIMLAEPEHGFAVMLRVRPGRHRKEIGQGKPWRDLVSYYSVRTIPFDQKRFTVPKGFIRAQDKSAFYFSENGVLKKSDIDDLFRGKLK